MISSASQVNSQTKTPVFRAHNRRVEFRAIINRRAIRSLVERDSDEHFTRATAFIVTIISRKEDVVIATVASTRTLGADFGRRGTNPAAIWTRATRAFVTHGLILEDAVDSDRDSIPVRIRHTEYFNRDELVIRRPEHFGAGICFGANRCDIKNYVSTRAGRQAGIR